MKKKAEPSARIKSSDIIAALFWLLLIVAGLFVGGWLVRLLLARVFPGPGGPPPGF